MAGGPGLLCLGGHTAVRFTVVPGNEPNVVPELATEVEDRPGVPTKDAGDTLLCAAQDAP